MLTTKNYLDARSTISSRKETDRSEAKKDKPKVVVNENTRNNIFMGNVIDIMSKSIEKMEVEIEASTIAQNARNGRLAFKDTLRQFGRKEFDDKIVFRIEKLQNKAEGIFKP